MEEVEREIIGYCEVSGEPIYKGESRIEDDGKLYKPENYEFREIKEQSFFDKLLRRS